jgi:hypothetical protein
LCHFVHIRATISHFTFHNVDYANSAALSAIT